MPPQLPEGWRYRTNWRGKLILQVRERKARSYVVGSQTYFEGEIWRDASTKDLTTFHHHDYLSA